MTAETRTNYQVCQITVMDTSDPDISFDADGICNYVHEFRAAQATKPSSEERQELLAHMVEAIREEGRGKQYDCILGLSGGVDSSYMAYLVHDWKLRPLVVHFDNGWNSRLAITNIERIVTTLGLDLQTFVMDWEEFRDLQRAYFKASVVDLEVPTDHMIFGALHKLAGQEGIKYILSGHNDATEWLLPKAWYYRKFDLANVLGIHRAHGELPIRHLPKLGVWQQAYFHHIKGVRTLQPLQLIEYNKAEAKRTLKQKLNWEDYGGKHHESTFTRFYQGYWLPRKFGIDKRKAHFSNLILSGQMTREAAIEELVQPPYEERLQQEDKVFVSKKLGFTPDELAELMLRPNVRHEVYGTDERQRALYFRVARYYGHVRGVLRRKPVHVNRGEIRQGDGAV